MGKEIGGPRHSMGYALRKSSRKGKELCFSVALSSDGTRIKAVSSLKRKDRLLAHHCWLDHISPEEGVGDG